MSLCHNDSTTLDNATLSYGDDMQAKKELLEQIAYIYIAIPILLLGIMGNVLNLITLNNKILRTEPFMYIRAMAVFDLLALLIILVATLNNANALEFTRHIWLFRIYLAHVQYPVLNTFLVASMYCAVVLTIERYIMLCHPIKHYARRRKSQVRLNILVILLLASMLHVPMAVQFSAIADPTGGWKVADNRYIMCSDPWSSIYTYYKLVREFVRFFGVVVLTWLNIVIIRGMKEFNQRRRSLHPKRSQLTNQTTIGNQCQKSSARQLAHRNDGMQIDRASTGAVLEALMNNCRKNSSHQQKISKELQITPIPTSRSNSSQCSSFKKGSQLLITDDGIVQVKQYAEKKVTVLMVVITVMYIFGNMPMACNMILYETSNKTFWYQVFRAMSNTAEVINHCANFYVFCMASSEYSRAFLHTCNCCRLYCWRPLARRLPIFENLSAQFGSVNAGLQLRRTENTSRCQNIDNETTENCGFLLPNKKIRTRAGSDAGAPVLKSEINHTQKRRSTMDLMIRSAPRTEQNNGEICLIAESANGSQSECTSSNEHLVYL